MMRVLKTAALTAAVFFRLIGYRLSSSSGPRRAREWVVLVRWDLSTRSALRKVLPPPLTNHSVVRDQRSFVEVTRRVISDRSLPGKVATQPRSVWRMSVVRIESGPVDLNV